MTLILSGTDGLSDIDGSAATPAIRGTDANTGIFFPASDTIAFSEGGAEVARFDSSGNLGIGTSSPSYRLHVSAAGNTIGGYFYTPSGLSGIRIETAANDKAVAEFYTNGNRNWSIGPGQTTAGAFEFRDVTAASTRMLIDSSGNVGIGTTTTTRAKLNIDTDGSNNAAGYGLALTNTAGGGATWTLQCGDQGVNNSAFTIRQTGISGTTRLKIGTDGYLTVLGVYALTTGSAANVFVDSNGVLQRSTSSLKYKTDIQDATHGLAEVMQLRPVIYKGINDGETVFGGFIAEEVDALGLTEFVQYAADGSPDALAYGNMVSLLAKAIQEQQALIQSLTARITALETP